MARELAGRYGVALDLLQSGPDGRILDFGCGAGHFLRAVMNAHNVEAHGCDVDPSALAATRDTCGSGVATHLIDDQAPHVPLPDGYFDAVTMLDALEHTDPASQPAVLGEIHRLLRDDGLFIVTVPHAGILGWADPENLKFRFPRLHRALYRRVKGADKYETYYGNEARYGNYSQGAMEHKHFTTDELSELLRAHGFEVSARRYYAVITPILRGLIELVEAIGRRRSKPDGRVHKFVWRLYFWDADFSAGKLSYNIGVAARRTLGMPAYAESSAAAHRENART